MVGGNAHPNAENRSNRVTTERERRILACVATRARFFAALSNDGLAGRFRRLNRYETRQTSDGEGSHDREMPVADVGDCGDFHGCVLLPAGPRFKDRLSTSKPRAGEPFGVGRIVLDLPPPDLPQPLGAEGIGLAERRGRVLYPAIDNPALGRLLRGLLGGAGSDSGAG